MHKALLLFIAAPFIPALLAQSPRTNPSYSGVSIVNAADSQSGPLAANAIGTIYGQNLSYTTASLASDDINGGLLPLGLPGTGVNVLVGGIAATVFYVSSTQINFLVPSILIPGQTGVQVVLNGIAGPVIPITLADCSPALFQLDAQTVIATRLDGSLVTAAAPAHPGEFLTFYATGLGDTVPPVVYRYVPQNPAPLQRLADFQVLLDGIPVERSLVLYAGIAPGFAGLYQVNVQIPNSAGQNPQVQIGLGSELSPSGLMLPLSTATGSN